MARRWHCQILDQDFGPMSFAELRELVQSGTLSANDLVRPEEKADWQRAETVVGLFRFAGAGKATSGSEPQVPALVEIELPAEVRGDASSSDPAGRRRVSRHMGWGSDARIGPRTGLVLSLLLIVGLFTALTVWSAHSQTRRFPLPYAERARALQQSADYTFLGWGPLSREEYVLLWGDAIALAGGITWGLIRWARAGDR